MSTHTLTDDERAQGMAAVGYEVTQMVFAARQLGPGDVRPDDLAAGVAQNSALESVLTHGRSLIEFIIERRKRKDEIRPDDFYAEGEPWPGPQGEVRARLNTLQWQMAKHLSHLSWARVRSGPAPEWDVGEAVTLIVDQLGKFADHLTSALDEGRVDPEVVKQLRAHLTWCRPAPANGWTPSAVASTTYDPFGPS